MNSLPGFGGSTSSPSCRFHVANSRNRYSLSRFIWLAVAMALGGDAVAATFYVSPNPAAGGRNSNGSLSKPWPLATALKHPPEVKPGDTILMLGGSYTATDFVSYLQGTAAAPITLASAPGALASLVTSGKVSASLTIYGSYVIFRDFDVSNSSVAKRSAGSRATGISMRTHHIKLINLSVHDAATGIGYWQEATDSEVYGCVVFNTGDSSLAHGIYGLNLAGSTSEKRIIHNVIVNSFGRNIHVYASDPSYSGLANFTVIGNTVANAASIDRSGGFSENLLVGGELPASGAVIRSNLTYNLDRQGHNHIGYSLTTPQNVDAVVEDNYFADPTLFRYWDELTVQHNTFVAPSSLALFDELATAPAPTVLSWDNNAYYSEQLPGALPFGYNASPNPFVGNLGFEDWKTVVGRGVDLNSTYVAGRPSAGEVFVYPNLYQPGRGNITIFNWPGLSTVTVDLTPCRLAEGQSYRIQNAQDFLGTPVRTGVFSAAAPTVSLPMTGLKVATPRGATPPPVPTSEFSVFVCLPQ